MSSGLPGRLFVYEEATRLCAFESFGAEGVKTAVILVPGLTDGPMKLPFVDGLARMVEARGCSLVQPILSSSYLGYGVSSLRQDGRELDALIGHLTAVGGRTGVVLIGHSTGCQDALWYARFGALRDRVYGSMLQAAISDREYMTSWMGSEKQEGYIKLAREIQGKSGGDALMPREVDSMAPVSVSRFLSFAEARGEDDMFSTDLPDEYVQSLYADVRTPLVMVQCGKDEYVSDHEAVLRMQSQHAHLYPGYDAPIILPEADHAISDEKIQAVFLEHVDAFLRRHVK